MPRVLLTTKHVRGKDYPPLIFEKAIRLLRVRGHGKKHKRLTFQKIAELCNVASHRTIEKWNRLFIHQRRLPANRGRPSRLTREEEAIVMGRVLIEHLSHGGTTTNDIISFAREMFKKDLNRQYVSRMARRFHFGAARAQGIAQQTLAPQKTAEGIDFLVEHQQRGISPSKLFILDKNGLHLGAIASRHWRPIGW
jgi:hypothetical protein